MSWLFAPNIKTIHGFSNRFGGVSSGSFASLNLGAQQDDRLLISKNRSLALDALNLKDQPVCMVNQVHGSKVILANKEIQEADAIVCNEIGLPIAIGVADCYPILYHDPINKVVGAAHAGWRGTVSGIAGNTVQEMIKLGAQAKYIQVAIGQGISTDKFAVGQEVIDRFLSSGFSTGCLKGNHIDLVAANKQVLLASGIIRDHIWSMNRCTFEPEFFSYRRDQGKTGRMWALIML